MPIVELKKRLHEAIDAIQDEQVLTDLLHIMLRQESYVQDIRLDETQIKVLAHREARLSNGESKALPLASFKSSMRNKYGI